MSHGTLGIYGDFEYFQVDDLIYRANSSNPLGVNGYRQGARFECKSIYWPERRAMLEKWTVAA
jgi:hypothetical protein